MTSVLMSFCAVILSANGFIIGALILLAGAFLGLYIEPKINETEDHHG